MTDYYLRVQIIAIVAAVLFSAFVIDLVRRRRLNEWYSLVWLAIGGAVAAFAFFRPLQFVLARLVGLYYPPLLVLGTILFLLLALSLHFSVVLNRLEGHNRRLAQRLAIVEALLAETSDPARRPAAP